MLTVDDWHLIDDVSVHRALVHVLDFAPANLSLILTSRTRPRLPLSRLRVRQQLTEVDAATLRFDMDETRAFLVDLNGLPLRGDDVARLSASTDGWVAALQLVSLSLRDTADPAALIRGFSGRHHSIGEYLAENALGALPADILEFLLVTSVCDRLCGDLAGRSRPGPTARRCSRSSSAVISSCGRSTPSASGSAATTCSPTTCADGWSATAPSRCHGCTSAHRCGSRATTWCLRPSPTPSPPPTSSGRPTWSSATRCRWSSTVAWSACSV